MIFSATLSNGWHGLLEDEVADRAHLMQDGFEFAMICILAILKNPVYAGAFAYGRISTRSRIIEGRAGKTAGNGVPMEQWVGTISFWYSTG